MINDAEYAIFCANAEGEEAYAANVPNTSNPYKKKDKYWYYGWLQGWFRAQDEYMGEQEWEDFDA